MALGLWHQFDTLACMYTAQVVDERLGIIPNLRSIPNSFFPEPRLAAAAMFRKVFAWVLIVVFLMADFMCFRPNNLLHAHSRYVHCA